MNLTATKANARLAKVKTKEQLVRLINKLDITASGSVTVLYSGLAAIDSSGSGQQLSSESIASSMHENGHDVRIINNTEAAKFLNVRESDPERNIALIETLERIFGDSPAVYGSEANRFLYGDTDGQNRVPNGAWDSVSARFVDATQGAVVTITGGADPHRVFAQTELPRIINNGKITTVDGIPHEILQQFTPEEAFFAVRAQSEVRASQLLIEVDDVGRPVDYRGTYRLDTRAFFADTPGMEGKAIPFDPPTRALGDFVPQERIVNHVDGVKQLQRVQDRLALNIADAAETNPSSILPDGSASALLRGLDHVGNAIDVLTLAMASLEAKAAFDRGDTEKAKAILMDWVLENGGALVAGRLAALATAPLLAAGPLGVLLAGGITIGASVLGGVFGDDVARQVFASLAEWMDDLIDVLKDYFVNAEHAASPIILDLDGNGVSTLGQTTSGIFFDHDASGFAERTGWVAPGDGLLVRDLNGNGTIETGAELFGNWTLMQDGTRAANGFEALKQLDDNQDTVITPQDPAWTSLQIWQDGNSNARVESGELSTLEAAGVAILYLFYELNFVDDQQGNLHRQMGFYQSPDEVYRPMHDVWFSVDLARTQQADPQPVSADIVHLPNLPSFGNVASLHQVMSADDSGQLSGLIQEWLAASSAQRIALIEPIIFHWTGVQNFVDAIPMDDPLPRRRLAALENLLGSKFRDGWHDDPIPGIRAYDFIESGFAKLVEQVESQLIAQADALPLLRAVSLTSAAVDGQQASDFGPVVEELRRQFDTGPDVEGLIKTGRVLDRLGTEATTLLQAVAEQAQNEPGMFGLHLQAMGSIDKAVFGGSEDDEISASSLDEWIEGGIGNDSLQGGDGNDILIGGVGSDSLSGDYGNDVFVFSAGDGTDIVTDNDSTPGNVDEVRFTDVTSLDVRGLERAGYHLLMQYASTDQLTVQNHFASDSYRIEQFRFQDGVVWGQAELDQLLLPAAPVA